MLKESVVVADVFQGTKKAALESLVGGDAITLEWVIVNRRKIVRLPGIGMKAYATLLESFIRKEIV